MKDLPHHIKKLNRQVLRSEKRDSLNEEQFLFSQEASPAQPQTEKQKKKQAKTRIAQEHKAHIPVHATPEERNQEMKHRVPVFDRNNASPKHAKASKKKTPKI